MTRRHRQLPEIQFHNPRLSKVGMEVMSLDVLRSRLPPEAMGPPQRVDFFLLLMIESGQGVHVVDFIEHRLAPGDVLMVQPGQVQAWRLTDALQGRLVLVSPAALGPSGGVHPGVTSLMAWDLWPTVTRPPEALFQQTSTDLLRLHNDLQRFDGSEGHTAIARHALVTLLLRLAHEASKTAGAGTGEAGQGMRLYRLFSHQLDALYMQRMGVIDHARRLGYSESSLSRACVEAVGYTAKQVIDRRVALEAKRLLAHSREPVAHIGHRLGFSEPTNFVKFFRRLCGETPLSFRERFGTGGIG